MSVPVSQEEITAEWFQTILDEAGECVSVDDVKVERGTKPGENFAAEVLRATVTGRKDGQPWSESYFIKMPVQQFMKNVLGDMKVFDQEVEAYDRIIPDMIRLQEGENKLLPDTPKSIFAKLDGDNGIIVMADLKSQGYTLYDARKGLDFEHCKVAMQSLAKFHALGYKCKFSSAESLIEKYPNLSNFAYSHEDAFKQMIETGIKLTKMVLASMPGMERTLKVFEEKGEAAVKKGSLNDAKEPLSTICHGDFWSNNMMFKYGNDEKLVSQKIIDLQMFHYGLPTKDLGFFFCLCTEGELRRNHLKDLLKYYHRQLFEYLDILGVTQITENEFSFESLWKMYYEETIHTGLQQAICFLFFILPDPEDLSKQEEMKDKSMAESMKFYVENMGEKLVSDPYIQTRMADLIDEMVSKEVFV